jgi:hypothetical protein
MALKRMSRYFAGEAERGLEASAWENQKVLAYLNHPMARLSLLIVFFDGNSLSFGDKLYILF